MIDLGSKALDIPISVDMMGMTQLVSQVSMDKLVIKLNKGIIANTNRNKASIPLPLSMACIFCIP